MENLIIVWYLLLVVASACGVAFVFANSKTDKLLSLKIARETKIPFKEVFETINEPSYFSKLISLVLLSGAVYQCWLYFPLIYLILIPLVILLTITFSDKYLLKFNSGENYICEVVMRVLDRISKAKSANLNADVSKMATISDYLIEAYKLDKSKSQTANEEFRSFEYLNIEDELVGFEKSKFLLKRAMRELFGGLKSLIFLLVIIMIGASAKYWFK